MGSSGDLVITPIKDIKSKWLDIKDSLLDYYDCLYNRYDWNQESYEKDFLLICYIDSIDNYSNDEILKLFKKLHYSKIHYWSNNSDIKYLNKSYGADDELPDLAYDIQKEGYLITYESDQQGSYYNIIPDVLSRITSCHCEELWT